MTNKRLGERIKKYLKKNGITQIFISRETGIPMDKLSNSLNGKRQFTFEEYELICGTLEVNTDLFLKPRTIKGKDSFLKHVKTCELVNELKGREGVRTENAEPYEEVLTSIEGPATILIIID